MYNKVFH